MPEEIGPELVKCIVCGNKKHVRGRSMGTVAARGLCCWDCPGYMQKPIPSELHPGEKRKDFGFQSGIGILPEEDE